ncbi:MAG TPA: hypothetical protein VNB06_21555, partial [Thermoanaerobaculia bacterium]|nr:hypothetical protein [Thermoanaerobaculia bacterium]
MSSPARSQLSGRRAWLPPIAVVAAGAAGSIVLAAWSPLAASDPLRGVVTALPLVIALLGAAGGLALPSREPSGGDRALASELMLLSVWIAAVFARPLLGLAGVDRALAVALVLLLGTHLARRLVAIGRSLPALDASAVPPAATPMLGPRLFLFALAFYTAVLPWSTSQRPPDGDEPWYLLTAHSLAQDFDTDLADDYRDRESLRFLDRAIEPQPGDPVGPSGEIYSRHAPFLPILLAPFYAAAGKHGALFAMAMLTAATLAAWWPLARGIWPDRPRELLAQWSVLALLPPFLVYSHQLWVEVPAALMVTLAALSIQRLSHRQRRMDWVVLAATLLALPALKLRFGLLSASLLALAFVRLARHRRRLLVVGAVGVVVGAGLLLYNRHLFGNALRIHEWQELLLYRYPASDYVSHFVGLFFDLAFGLFAAAPIWMLLLPGVVRTLRSDRALRLGQDLAIVCLPYLILVASRREWFGGWSPPFRYPLALLPLLALLAVPAWSDLRHSRARAVTAMLALASLGLVVGYVAAPGLTYSFADGRSRLLDS